MQAVSRGDESEPSTAEREPKLSDFYNPSRQRKDTEIALVVGGMAVVGFLAYKFSK